MKDKRGCKILLFGEKYVFNCWKKQLISKKDLTNQAVANVDQIEIRLQAPCSGKGEYIKNPIVGIDPDFREKIVHMIEFDLVFQKSPIAKKLPAIIQVFDFFAGRQFAVVIKR